MLAHVEIKIMANNNATVFNRLVLRNICTFRPEFFYEQVVYEQVVYEQVVCAYTLTLFLLFIETRIPIERRGISKNDKYYN
jgi:hypothetical protein